MRTAASDLYGVRDFCVPGLVVSGGYVYFLFVCSFPPHAIPCELSTHIPSVPQLREGRPL